MNWSQPTAFVFPSLLLLHLLQLRLLLHLGPLNVMSLLDCTTPPPCLDYPVYRALVFVIDGATDYSHSCFSFVMISGRHGLTPKQHSWCITSAGGGIPEPPDVCRYLPTPVIVCTELDQIKQPLTLCITPSRLLHLIHRDLELFQRPDRA